MRPGRLLRPAAVLAAGLALGACAGLGVRPPDQDPAGAPLKERALSPDLRSADAALASTPGAAGGAALYRLGLDRAAAGDWAGASALWAHEVSGTAGAGWSLLARYQIARADQKLGRVQEAFRGYESLAAAPAAPDGVAELSRQACLGMIGGLDAADAQALLGDASPAFAEPLRLRVLDLDLAAGDTAPVQKAVDAYLLAQPQGPYAAQYADLSRRLGAQAAVARVLGLVVPSGGPLAPFGALVEQGARLAVDEANAGIPPDKRVSLLVADEGVSPAAAAAAVAHLVEDGHVIGVLGPLSSDDAMALVPLLPALRTPVLSPSASRPDLAGVSPWFFRDTLAPETQAAAMADYAAAMKLTRVATLAPDNDYGLVMARAFAARLKALGGVVPAVVTFTPGINDFRVAMLALGGIDPGVEKDADQDEMRDQQEKVEAASNGIGAALKPPAEDSQGGLSSTAKVRLMVVDFGQDTACAALNAGRAFADRFARTLSRLHGVEVIGPQASLRYWTPLTTSAGALTPAQAAQAGQAAGADFVLVGKTATLPPDPVRWPNRGLYSLDAQLLDSLTGAVVAHRDFTWTQYQAPPSNTLGLQAVYMPAGAEDVVAAVPDMLFFDLNVPLLGSDQWDRPELRDHLAELEGDVFTTAYWGDSPDPGVRRFDAAYRAAYAAKPDVLAAQAYGAAALMARAILGGVSDREGLRSWLTGVSGYDGACGHFGFRQGQDADRRPALVGVRKGAFTLIQEP